MVSSLPDETMPFAHLRASSTSAIHQGHSRSELFPRTQRSLPLAIRGADRTDSSARDLKSYLSTGYKTSSSLLSSKLGYIDSDRESVVRHGKHPGIVDEEESSEHPPHLFKTTGMSSLRTPQFLEWAGASLQSPPNMSLRRESLTSQQTFKIARSSLASYITAPSGPRSKLDLQRLLLDNPLPARDQVLAIEAIDLETALISTSDIVHKIVDCCNPLERVPSALSLHTALRKSFSHLRDLSGPITYDNKSFEDVLRNLRLEIEDLCRTQGIRTQEAEVLSAQASIHFWRYAVTQPHLQEVISKSLTARGKPFTYQWLLLLRDRHIILDPKEALDWSGRGQHVEYLPKEEKSIPLVHQGNLGFGASGFVDRVRCRRIDLARKSIACVRNLTRSEAANEVGHLQRLQHRHIVRLVGTYMLRKRLSILMYPATEYSLDDFLDLAYETLTDSSVALSVKDGWWALLVQVIACLANAMAFIHENFTKHMDIKPTNILVHYSGGESSARVFFTDFGIARSYQSAEASITDSPIPHTRKYTAPEVAQQTKRGPSADIFSLGCVFAEIFATLLCTPELSRQDQLRQIRSGDTDDSYQANTENVISSYLSRKEDAEALLYFLETSGPRSKSDSHLVWMWLLPAMLATRPEARPSAATLKRHTQQFACGTCDGGPEPFKAVTECDSPD